MLQAGGDDSLVCSFYNDLTGEDEKMSIKEKAKEIFDLNENEYDALKSKNKSDMPWWNRIKLKVFLVVSNLIHIVINNFNNFLLNLQYMLFFILLCS